MIGCWPAQLLERGGVGREAGLRLLLRREAELVEQDLAQLRRRVDVELVAGVVLDLGVEPRRTRRRAGRRSARSSATSTPTPTSSMRASTRDERHLDVVVERAQALRVERAASSGATRRSTASARRPAIVRRRRCRRRRGRAGPRRRASARSQRSSAGVAQQQLLEQVRRLGRVEQVGGDARCRGRGAHVDADRSRPRISSFARWPCTGRPPTPTSGTTATSGASSSSPGTNDAVVSPVTNASPISVERPSTPAPRGCERQWRLLFRQPLKRSVASDGLRTTVTSASSTSVAVTAGPEAARARPPRGGRAHRPRGPPSPRPRCSRRTSPSCAARPTQPTFSTGWRNRRRHCRSPPRGRASRAVPR